MWPVGLIGEKRHPIFLPEILGISKKLIGVGGTMSSEFSNYKNSPRNKPYFRTEIQNLLYT